jgi:hypothetical protein
LKCADNGGALDFLYIRMINAAKAASRLPAHSNLFFSSLLVSWL